MKPYQLVPIQECGDALVPIPPQDFVLMQPHPYAAIGAPYADKSPFHVRQGVLDRLHLAQIALQQRQPGWQLLIFDAYRPLAVQQFMVDYTFAEVAQQRQLNPTTLSEQERQEIFAQVYEFWARPNPDPTQPPPHSTGGAIDVTLIDETGTQVDMGSPIDEISPRSYPNHYAESREPHEQAFQRSRSLLHTVMTEAGFMRHLGEWWHFCYGDQMWAWLKQQENPAFSALARYGRWET